MEQIASIQAIAQVIQLAVAPVFLLAGIAGLIGVLSTRLGRVIDRARVIERRIPEAVRDEHKQVLMNETTSLWRRIHLMNWGIRLCISGALMVCIVIVTLFLGDMVRVNIASLIAAEFVVAMLFIISGLVCLLREIGISIRQLRQGLELAIEDARIPGRG